MVIFSLDVILTRPCFSALAAFVLKNTVHCHELTEMPFLILFGSWGLVSHFVLQSSKYIAPEWTGKFYNMFSGTSKERNVAELWKYFDTSGVFLVTIHKDTIDLMINDHMTFRDLKKNKEKLDQEYYSIPEYCIFLFLWLCLCSFPAWKRKRRIKCILR